MLVWRLRRLVLPVSLLPQCPGSSPVLWRGERIRLATGAEPVLSPTYTMLRIWDEVVKTARSLWGPTDDIELGLARASCVERCILSLQVVGDLQVRQGEVGPG